MKKTLTLAAVLVTAALFSVGVSPAQAAPVADQTQSGLTGSAQGAVFLGNFLKTEIGNSFTAGLSGQLTSIEVQTSSYGASPTAHGAEAKVWSVDGNGLPTGTALATATIPVASIPTAGGTLTITFSTPATVTAGTNYAFTIGFIDTPGATASSIYLPGGVAPLGKRAVSFSNGTPALNPIDGINFTTYVDEGDSEGPPTGASDEELADTGANASAVVALAPLGALVLLASALIVRRRLVSHR